MENYNVSLGEEEAEEREAQVQEGGRGEPPPEESKLSRLFYLQLYSSVLNAEKAHKKREKERRRKERRSLKLKLAKKKVVKSLSWMDVTNLLARSFSTEGSTRDKDIGDVEVVTEVARVGRLVLPKRLKKSFVKDVMVDRRLSVGRGQYLPQAQVKSLKIFLTLFLFSAQNYVKVGVPQSRGHYGHAGGGGGSPRERGGVYGVPR